MCLFPRHIDKLLAGALAKDDENKNKVEDVTKKCFREQIGFHVKFKFNVSKKDQKKQHMQKKRNVTYEKDEKDKTKIIKSKDTPELPSLDVFFWKTS